MILTISPELEAKVQQRAETEGLTAEKWLFRIVEQELASPEPVDDRPVSEMIREIWADMPEDVRAKLPVDGASEHDHYIYGLPKRNQ
ncbi:MAG TPA: hypothetical protein VK604_09050 [Bryobacteraceae bacterium]|nr:hypothetical protein [Bryobacteraceae bacterium]